MAQDLPVLSTTSLANEEDDLKIGNHGSYAVDTNNERDQYVGLWEYNQNGIIFQLKIEKKDKVVRRYKFNGVVTKYSFCDRVILKYKIVKNNIVIYDNLSELNVDPETGWGLKKGSLQVLFGRILDRTRNVRGSYTIEKLSGNPQKINFNLVLGDYKFLNDPSFYQDGQPLFSIPTGGIEMVKID